MKWRRTESAIKALTASIQLNPSFAFAHAMLGMAHNYAGLAEPITMVRRHAEEAFAELSMLEPQLLEEG